MYASMARYYDEIFPLLPAGVDFVTSEIVHAPPQTVLEGCCGGPGAFPALPGNEHHPVRVLDTGCATGKFSLALAEKGYSVDGIDNEEEMIQLAREKSEDKKITSLVTFHAADLQDIHSLFEKVQFQSVLCMGNTLPHILDSGTRLKILTQFRECITQDGVCIFQLLNYSKILIEKPSVLPVIETENIIFTRSYSYPDDHEYIIFTTSIRLKDSGEIYTGSASLAPITEKQLSTELMKAGFSSVRFFGNYAKDAFNPATSDVLLCTAAP